MQDLYIAEGTGDTQAVWMPDVHVGCVLSHDLQFRPRENELGSAMRNDAATRFANGKRRLIRDTARYKCYGLVLGWRKGHLQDDSDENVRAALLADGFKLIQKRSELQVGDVVLYSMVPPDGVLHVASVVQPAESADTLGGLPLVGDKPDVLVVSKFGHHGEYLHDIEDVPALYGTPAEYWHLGFPNDP